MPSAGNSSEASWAVSPGTQSGGQGGGLEPQKIPDNVTGVQGSGGDVRSKARLMPANV